MSSEDKAAQRWCGVLFEDFRSPLMWKDKYYHTLEPPHSVTFPICIACGRLVWDWPHFEEEVPSNAVCETCFREANEEGHA